jgi:predicted dehydrogenase
MISIAVIGQGLWGHKLTQSLKKNSSNHEVDLISARDFLDGPRPKLYDVVWIASRPSEQVKVLELATSSSKLIILEKPICSNLEDYIRVEKMLMNDGFNIGLSRPWSFSNVWLNAIEILKSWELSGASVKFQRTGPASHTYLTPVEDWIPHDIYLASDLFPAFENEFSVSRYNSNSNKFELSLNSRSKTTLSFSFKESASKESTVTIKSLSGEILVNFYEKVIQLNGKKIEKADPGTYDDISKNLYSILHGDNKRTSQLVRTQKWIKALIEQSN